MPPLVAALRKAVKQFRDSDYAQASPTSRGLLNWWFKERHFSQAGEEFCYFFAQREALETLVYLHDVVRAKDPYDLMRFDKSGKLSRNMFPEHWRRYVIKMATGSGKTKVMSLVLAWSFFHKLYETGSELSRNFLVITPNIIVLDRVYKDFEGLRIFFEDPVLPDYGYEGRNWKDDFQLTLHKQDDVRMTHRFGNIFLTNIHRVYQRKEVMPSLEDTFLGEKPVSKASDSKVDLGMMVRDIDELAVLNDEAHHIHDEQLAWFKSIENIHHRLVQKGGSLSLQVDVTATPRHNNGAVFEQVVSDYPLVEAIAQDVVKHPVLPDKASCAKLSEKQTFKYAQKYADYIDLGVIEWRKVYAEHEKANKKAILFVMTDDTRNCDGVAAYLEEHYSELQGAVLVIHTKKNGEIFESTASKKATELEKLRGQAHGIDSNDSPYKAIVSVLMLKEGWDVRNVTVIVGLRTYSAKSNILPEQTLGRGLRKMYTGDSRESVSVVGTNAFMEFVESIKREGVSLEYKPMGAHQEPIAPLVIEVDHKNPRKDIDALDIEIPKLTARVFRAYENLPHLNIETKEFQAVEYRQFNSEEQREIVFRDIATGEVEHTTCLDAPSADNYRSVIAYFSGKIINDMKLVTGYDNLYGKMKTFIKHTLFGQLVDLDSANTLRNLSEMVATKTLMETFKKSINALTTREKGKAEISGTTKLAKTRPFFSKDRGYLKPQKSVFNYIIGDSHLELEFARFLEDCDDVVSYAKNYPAVFFKIDYVNADGDLSNYYPDFIVKTEAGKVVIAETKGLEDLDVPLKMERLKQWCGDVNSLQNKPHFDYVFVDQAGFETYRPNSFGQLMQSFGEYKD